MNKMVENAEAERTRLIELIRSLEMKLSSIEQRSVEEQWSMRQRQATLDAERVAFERERTFMREKMDDEEKRIQVIANTLFPPIKFFHLICFALLGIERETILRAQTSHGYHRCRAAKHSK